MDDSQIDAIVEAILKELRAAGAGSAVSPAARTRPSSPDEPANRHESSQPQAANDHPNDLRRWGTTASLEIDLPDPALPEHRYRPRVRNPGDPEALKALMASTTARIGVGRAGPHYDTFSLLLFQGDHAITQDALMRDVDPQLLDALGLFTVQTRVGGGKQEYLLRPDLGRQLDDSARKTLQERCVKSPNLQLVVGDGLSAAAVEANVRDMFPILLNGAAQAGLTVGTPFFVKHCRVGVLNDIGDLLQPDVAILLIGERPGLGRAESLSAYMAYRPKAGDSDADRDVVCNIFQNGGTNPLEGAAYTLQIAQKMMKHQASGVKLKLATT
jgi:ethanolamine ammonia-lyase small subunit